MYRWPLLDEAQYYARQQNINNPLARLGCLGASNVNPYYAMMQCEELRGPYDSQSMNRKWRAAKKFLADRAGKKMPAGGAG